MFPRDEQPVDHHFKKIRLETIFCNLNMKFMYLLANCMFSENGLPQRIMKYFIKYLGSIPIGTS